MEKTNTTRIDSVNVDTPQKIVVDGDKIEFLITPWVVLPERFSELGGSPGLGRSSRQSRGVFTNSSCRFESYIAAGYLMNSHVFVRINSELAVDLQLPHHLLEDIGMGVGKLL